MKMREQIRCEEHNWVSYGETLEQASPCPTCSVIEAHAAGRREVLDGMETVIAASRETYQLSPKLSFSEKHLVAGVFETMGVCIAMLRTQLDKDGEG